MESWQTERYTFSEQQSAPRLSDLPGISLADFVEKTVAFTLHDWQRNYLCPILERLKDERGVRLLVHGPPQLGKSIILSKRFPAWLLGHDPLKRLILSAYNKDVSVGQFGEANRNLMRSSEYARIFPHTQIPAVCSSSEFSTLQKLSEYDGQDSITCLGIQTGFTGKGTKPGDVIIVDDPYASVEDSRSTAINEKTWRFFTEGVFQRLHPEANAVVMFHRYRLDDVAGRLIEKGGWEYVRFPAIADGRDDDPTGREVGEPLSPMFTIEQLESLKDEDPKIFASLWQGDPKPDNGSLFRETDFQRIDTAPDLKIWVRFWDFAYGEGKQNDWTAGALVGVDDQLNIYVKDMVRFKGQWPDVQEIVSRTIAADALDCQRNESKYWVGMDAHAQQMVFVQDFARNAALSKIPITGDRTKGKLPEKILGVATRARLGKLYLVRGYDHMALIKEAVDYDPAVPDAGHDDQLYALQGAYNLLWEIRGSKAQHETIKPNTPRFYEELARRQQSQRPR